MPRVRQRHRAVSPLSSSSLSSCSQSSQRLSQFTAAENSEAPCGSLPLQLRRAHLDRPGPLPLAAILPQTAGSGTNWGRSDQLQQTVRWAWRELRRQRALRVQPSLPFHLRFFAPKASLPAPFGLCRPRLRRAHLNRPGPRPIGQTIKKDTDKRGGATEALGSSHPCSLA